MSDDVFNDDVPPDEALVTHDARDVDRITPAVRTLNPEWTTGVLLDDLAVRWTPHLVRPDKRWALHVHLSTGAPTYIARRLTAAAGAGHIVHVALPLESLYDADLLEVLSDADAYVYVCDGDVPTARRHHLAALADLGVPVDPELRKRIARRAWDRRAEGTVNQRGRRLEALLAFLLSRIADFRVLQRNFRTETAEIDIVLQVDHFSNRCWYEPGVPFVIVESKNTADEAGQPVVTMLIRRLQTSRGRARLGLLFSVGGFTADAEKEELRQSEGNLCVAFFDSDAIAAMIEADDLDGWLDDHVARAMLR